jgi:hypothetical protein
MHDHHIVFRSQGGLDLQANMTELSYEQHLGNKSPHRDREVDISLKTDLQNTYYNLFSNKRNRRNSEKIRKIHIQTLPQSQKLCWNLSERGYHPQVNGRETLLRLFGYNISQCMPCQ